MNKVTCTYKHPGYYKYSIQCGDSSFTARLEKYRGDWSLVVDDANGDVVYHWCFDGKGIALDYLTNDFAQ